MALITQFPVITSHQLRAHLLEKKGVYVPKDFARRDLEDFLKQGRKDNQALNVLAALHTQVNILLKSSLSRGKQGVAWSPQVPGMNLTDEEKYWTDNGWYLSSAEGIVKFTQDDWDVAYEYLVNKKYITPDLEGPAYHHKGTYTITLKLANVIAGAIE